MINHGDMASWGAGDGLGSRKILEVRGDGRGIARIDTFGVTMLRKINISV